MWCVEPAAVSVLMFWYKSAQLRYPVDFWRQLSLTNGNFSLWQTDIWSCLAEICVRPSPVIFSSSRFYAMLHEQSWCAIGRASFDDLMTGASACLETMGGPSRRQRLASSRCRVALAVGRSLVSTCWASCIRPWLNRLFCYRLALDGYARWRRDACDCFYLQTLVSMVVTAGCRQSCWYRTRHRLSAVTTSRRTDEITYVIIRQRRLFIDWWQLFDDTTTV